MDGHRPAGGGGAPAGARAGRDEHVAGLDGIRGIAIAAVLLYHADLSVAEGGFLGVSAFFTLSGFLIASLLLREHERTGRLDLRRFWVRRCRRLLPAGLLGLGAVAAFGFTVASATQQQDLPGELLAALGFVTNWQLVLAGRSYADLFADPSPLQHFWSLAVEWQLYVALPLLLWPVLGRSRSRTARAAWLAAGVAASTGLMALLQLRGASLDRLYYGTDTRAAELLAGGLLAVLLHGRDLATPGRWRRPLAAAGVLGLAGLLVAYRWVELSDERLYRGGFLAVSVLTGLVIVAVVAGAGPAAALHSWGPLTYLGRISYGVYVFHWPVYLWLDERETGLEGWPLLLVRLGVTLPLAVASFHLLEQPIRQGQWSQRRLPLGWAAGLAVVGLVAAVVGLRQLDPDADVAAGVGTGVAAMPTVPAGGDGVLDVLVIAGPEEAAVVDELVARGQGADALRITVAAPFACDRVEGATCANWLA